MTAKTIERDREATEGRLLDAVGELIREQGFERVGVNAVSAYSGVSKILIYRYFGSIEGLMAAYIRQHDFWINLPHQMPDRDRLPAYLKEMFRSYIARLRSDLTLKRLCRWELSTDNELVKELRKQRERQGMAQIEKICELTGFPVERMAVLATFLTASVTYLAMLEEYCPVYNGISIGDDAGWERICRGAELFIDRLFQP